MSDSEFYVWDVPIEVDQHLKKYWRLSVRFFEQSDFSLSLFFAITLIEELGKVFLFNRFETKEGWRRIFYRHDHKYDLAINYTTYINSRLSRIYGQEEKRFFKWWKSGELFNMRNEALYTSLSDSTLRTPEQMISKNNSFLVVCMAGEMLAESQGFYSGTDVPDWQIMIDEVDRFREEFKPDDWCPDEPA